ncbi:MAG: hypothetical protein RID91_02025 [Azospirillaceae bacterium]
MQLSRLALYQKLFELERESRENIQSGVAVPVATLSFTMFGLGVVAQRIGEVWPADEGRAVLPVAAAVFAAIALAFLIIGVYRVLSLEHGGRASGDGVYRSLANVSIPTPEALDSMAKHLRDKLAHLDDDHRAERVSRELEEDLAGRFYKAHLGLAAMNERNRSLRGKALSSILFALAALAASLTTIGLEAILMKQEDRPATASVAGPSETLAR